MSLSVCALWLLFPLCPLCSLCRLYLLCPLCPLCGSCVPFFPCVACIPCVSCGSCVPSTPCGPRVRCVSLCPLCPLWLLSPLRSRWPMCAVSHCCIYVQGRGGNLVRISSDGFDRRSIYGFEIFDYFFFLAKKI